MLSKYDNVLIGVLVAIVVAVLGYAASEAIVRLFASLLDVALEFRDRTLVLIGIFLNIIPLNYFRNKYWNRSLRGVVIGTFILAIAWFVYFGQDLLNGAE